MLECIECIGDDLPKGKVTDFRMSVTTKRNEVVGFSWIVFKSRAHRHADNKKVMADPRFATLSPTPRSAPEARGRSVLHAGYTRQV